MGFSIIAQIRSPLLTLFESDLGNYDHQFFQLYAPFYFDLNTNFKQNNKLVA